MKKKAIGSLVLVSAMAMGNMSAFAADATKNADGKYDPEITITIGKQLDENTDVTVTARTSTRIR